MSCNHCPPSDDKQPQPNADDRRSSRASGFLSGAIPEGSALLSSSCCWLPAVLDFIFAGSLSVTGIQNLRYIFASISLATLGWNISREGLNRANIRRMIISFCVLAWSQYGQSRDHGRHHSCH